ncbi:hypothetical protein CJD36_007230 [Flavipsychrobacter stenotrophus]|uniref:DUF4252 domain-containing protein n=1 Tax=Flavipsychrobacter stenotrophus TaxID=2077091 RepID=A0A2S7SY76_9BACT|nr:hypothetical protein [Flavipsychrobacter stenotrophus]PQJ11581.1 hypothetical protein CJD36_007230 [Flavipsychrobacter stenotrophus]
MKRSFSALAVAIIFLFSSFAAATWQLYENTEGGYKVLLPGVPEESSQDIQSAIGPLTMHMAMLETSDDVLVYMANYSDYPDSLVNSKMPKEDITMFFNNAMDGAAKNVSGTITRKVVLNYKTYPGRHMVAEIKEKHVVMEMDMYLIKNRVYFLEAIYMKDAKDITGVKKFFSSFQLTAVK